jgi:hypothetical protein
MPDNDERPTHFKLPDLTDLETNMIGAWTLTAVFLVPYTPGRASMLLPTFVRSVEVALRSYAAARVRLRRSVERDSLVDYIRGMSDMELAVIALNRSMRIAVRFVRLPDVNLKKAELPSAAEIDQLRKIRVAIEHIDESVVSEDRANKSETLSLNVRADCMVIHDKNGVLQRVDHMMFGTWLRKLHYVAKSLVHDTERWNSSEPTSGV